MSRGLKMSRQEYESLCRKNGQVPDPYVTAYSTGKQPIAPLTIEKAPEEKSGPKLNKTETAFLEILKRRHPEPAHIRVMPYRFQLGFKCSYLPDFVVIDPPHKIKIYETKGAYIFEDAMVKFKTAARMFTEFEWILAQYKKGEWIETKYS